MSTTTETTTKMLKTSAKAKAGATKTTKTTTTTTAREELTKEEAASLAPGSATVTGSTVKGDELTVTPATTATFREGKNGVSFFLMDISHAQRDIRRMEDSLIEHVKDTMCILETRSGETIELMYIGKTHCDADKRKTTPTFDPLNHENWTLSGINRRWTRHKKNPKVPSEGMVVLCAFTKHDLLTGARRSQEHLALAMEQRLIHYFQFVDTKTIVVNDEFKPGGTTNHTKDTSRELSISVLSDISELDLSADTPIPPEPTYCAYVVYMTYSYLPPKKKWPGLRQKQKIALEKQREEKEKRSKKPKDKDDSDTDSGEDEVTSKDDSVQDEESLLDEESITSPLFHSTPISSPLSALSSKENIQPLSSPLSTVKRDLLPALLQTV